MSQAEQFLRFIQQRNEEALQRWQVAVHIDGAALVITQRWSDARVQVDDGGGAQTKEQAAGGRIGRR